MSLLTIIQDAADRLGIVRPSSVVGAADAQVRQLLGLAQQEGKALARRGSWQALITEKTITATATEEQTNALPTDFDRMIEGSFYNRTQDRRVAGPISPQKWQALKTGLYTLAWDAFRIRGSSLLMNPTPTAGDTLAYEYVSLNWCSSADGVTTRSAWAADDDIGRLDEELMTLGVAWRFLKAKGFDYGEAFRSYEMEVQNRLANDGASSILDLNGDTISSGVYDPTTPEGNWTL